jgi:NADH:ubiquinone oxidoreductase subunit 5 (subunit L)/multisubunit Na+/H+ antiporter MnhA subunit
MTTSLHPAAPHHLPPFITAPGETDILMVVMAVFLVFAVLAVGILFLRLHTLPERMAHRSHKLQFEIVAVLGLLALFTHMHIFWVAGLLLALVDLPDFGSPLNRIAGSLERIAGSRPQTDAVEAPDGTRLGIESDQSAPEVSDTVAPTRLPKERIHA